MTRVLVLNGPNLSRLGTREPDVYGLTTWPELAESLSKAAVEGETIEVRQTDDESELIGWLHEAVDTSSEVVLNPAAFTHYSYSVRDAVAMVTSAGLSLIEVHISNPHAREEFRHNSVISAVATGVIAGFGANSYHLALAALRLRRA
jgi:3-dehydroquinate dehydratase-2